jgi:hypothetical protein
MDRDEGIGPGSPREGDARRKRHEDIRLPGQHHLHAPCPAQCLRQFAGEGQDEVGLGVIAPHGPGIDAAMAGVEHDDHGRPGGPCRRLRLRADTGREAIGHTGGIAEPFGGDGCKFEDDGGLPGRGVGLHRRDPGQHRRFQRQHHARPPRLEGRADLDGGHARDRAERIRHPVPDHLAEIDDDPPGIVKREDPERHRLAQPQAQRHAPAARLDPGLFRNDAGQRAEGLRERGTRRHHQEKHRAKGGAGSDCSAHGRSPGRFRLPKS